MVKTNGEEKTCQNCGEWFPKSHLENGLCLDCLDKIQISDMQDYYEMKYGPAKEY